MKKNRKYNDLIYYKQDVIDAYSDVRKALNKSDIEDLLRCVTLYLEKSAKDDKFDSHIIPNIGILHKKVNKKNIFYPSKDINEDEVNYIKTLYLDLNTTPIILRDDKFNRFFKNMSLEEIQDFQNNNND